VSTSPNVQGTKQPPCRGIVLSHYGRDTNFMPVDARKAYGVGR
jgi:hypothetical protein